MIYWQCGYLLLIPPKKQVFLPFVVNDYVSFSKLIEYEIISTTFFKVWGNYTTALCGSVMALAQFHKWMNLNLIPYFLKPLAGPNEAFHWQLQKEDDYKILITRGEIEACFEDKTTGHHG